MTSRSQTPLGLRRNANTSLMSPVSSEHGRNSSLMPSSHTVPPTLPGLMTPPVKSGLHEHQVSMSKMKDSVNSNTSLFTSGRSGYYNKSSNKHINGSNPNAFNPNLILCQMLAMQCFHYVFFGFVIQTNHLLFGTSVTLDRLFTTKYLNFWSTEGWIDNYAVLLTFVFQAILLALIVEKSRKCLDFSVTLFFFHFLFCTIYSRSVPHTWDWWIVHVLGLIIMILLGEFLCSRRELMDIPLLPL